jgi:hypothetical protein
MKKYVIKVTLLGLFLAFNTVSAQLITKEERTTVKEILSEEKIPVLNIGMFHMGYTSDATSTEYDEQNKKSKAQIKEVNEMIAKFRPTVILVEEIPENQERLFKAYTDYLKDQNSKSAYDNNEIKLMAFEIGRLAQTKRIYAIDHHMGYDYMLKDLVQKLAPEKYFKTGETLEKLKSLLDVDVQKIGLKKMIALMNQPETYDALINLNADALMFINSDDKFEGADEAAKFYQRNIRMFANINKIKMSKDDRVLIISGGTHASFFQKFMSRSYVYDLVPVSKYVH